LANNRILRLEKNETNEAENVAKLLMDMLKMPKRGKKQITQKTKPNASTQLMHM